MKKLIYTVLAIVNLITISTAMVLGYNYIWFGVEMVSPDRVLFTLLAAFLVYVFSITIYTFILEL